MSQNKVLKCFSSFHLACVGKPKSSDQVILFHGADGYVFVVVQEYGIDIQPLPRREVQPNLGVPPEVVAFFQ